MLPSSLAALRNPSRGNILNEFCNNVSTLEKKKKKKKKKTVLQPTVAHPIKARDETRDAPVRMRANANARNQTYAVSNRRWEEDPHNFDRFFFLFTTVAPRLSPTIVCSTYALSFFSLSLRNRIYYYVRVRGKKRERRRRRRKS